MSEQRPQYPFPDRTAGSCFGISNRPNKPWTADAPLSDQWQSVFYEVFPGPIVISSSQGRNFPDVPYDQETGEPLAINDLGSLWEESLTRLKQAGWWLELTPDNLRKPAYVPLHTFHNVIRA